VNNILTAGDQCKASTPFAPPALRGSQTRIKELKWQNMTTRCDFQTKMRKNVVMVGRDPTARDYLVGGVVVWRGVVVTSLIRSVKLLYAGPG